MSAIYALRGATTIENDNQKEITAATVELLNEMKSSNFINSGSIRLVYAIFSTTKDIHSYYPATAARLGKLIDCPLFSVCEPDIKNSMPLCIRVLLVIEHDSVDEQFVPKHIYLHKAIKLREDLYENSN